MYCQLHFVGGLDEAVRQQLCSSTNTSMTAPFYGERTTKVGALGKNSAGKCVFELSNGMFYRQTGQTGAKKTYLDYFRWHYSIYMVKIQISCYLIYLFAWIKPVAENGWTEKINSVCLNLVFWSIFTWPQLQWYPRILVEAPCYLKPNSTDKERLRATKGHRFWGTSAGYGSKWVAPKFGGWNSKGRLFPAFDNV